VTRLIRTDRWYQPSAARYAVHSLERRLLLAAGDPDLNFGTQGFLVGGDAPIEKAVRAGTGVLFLSRSENASSADIKVSRLLANGQPDSSFGINGQFVLGPTPADDVPLDITVDSSGRIVVLASRIDFQTSVFEQFIFRLNGNGSLDTSFNETGERVISTDSSTNYVSIAVDATGAIYAGGGGPGFLLMQKFAPAGQIDDAFGSSGTLSLSAPTGSEFSEIVVSATTIVAAGSDFSNSFIFSLIPTDGSSNTGFGTAGVVSIPGVSELSDVRIDSVGRIVAMGFDQAGAVVSRFTATGAVDTSFAGTGQVTLGATQFESMDVGPADNISVAGTAGNALIVRRLLGVNGQLDIGYGNAGEALGLIPVSIAAPGAPTVVVLPDASTFVAGGDFEIGDAFYIARFLGQSAVFATFDSRSGVLSVAGTPGADQVFIDLVNAQTIIAQLGPNQLSFNAAVVVLINIDVGSGPDGVVISPTVSVPHTVLLGGGNNSFSSASLAPATVIGGGGNDTLFGGPGNDFLQGNGGSDQIFGNDGNDTVDTGSGGDIVDGGGGDDSLTGGDGADNVSGGPGNDILFGRAGPDTLNGGDGNDSIVGEDGNDLLLGGAGNDTIEGGAGADTIDGQAGADLIFTGPGGGFATGGIGNDRIEGGGGNDVLDGGPGNDTLFGFGGADQINGGTENDLIDTGSGGDTANGEAGDDSVLGGDGADFLIGEIGNDTLRGRAGDDTLSGGEGNDLLEGEAGNDAIMGDAGNDSLIGGIGNDELSGAAGADTIDAGAGNDRLFGGIGNDTLMGGDGFDTLDGQLGFDLLSGGAGNDLLISDDGTRDTLNGDQGLDIARGDIDEAYALVEYLYRFV